MLDTLLFACAGHVNVCRYLLEAAGERSKDLANTESTTLATPIMWAAWAGSLEVVKLLVSYEADPHFCNKDGCSSAHWAAAGGNVDVCKYLYEEVGVDFDEPDNSGKVPLNHAIDYGHDDVVKWILKTIYSDPDRAAKLFQDEKIALSSIAQGYLKDWKPDEEIKQAVLEQRSVFVNEGKSASPSIHIM